MAFPAGRVKGMKHFSQSGGRLQQGRSSHHTVLYCTAVPSAINRAVSQLSRPGSDMICGGREGTRANANNEDNRNLSDGEGIDIEYRM